jgi:hypothetical protein
VSGTLDRLEAFIAAWRGPLESGAEVIFRARTLGGDGGAPVQVADRFVAEQGFKPIGFDWEMLDASAGADAPRSALGAFVDALAKDLAMRGEWLGEARATECGRAFIGCFDPARATILANHIVRDGGKSEGWFPISTAPLEWAFIGYDDSAIALLLLKGED